MTQQIQVVVVDLNMPVMDGIAFIKHLRGLPAYRFTPVLMLTTESQESRKLEGKKAGATGWLIKPFNPEQLVAVADNMHAAVARRRDAMARGMQAAADHKATMQAQGSRTEGRRLVL